MTKKIAIMQPTFLPWTGYVALAMCVDHFVFLDSVQFSRRSWQQRNRVKNAGGETMLTVPVVKGPRDQVISDVQIKYDRTYPSKHLATLIHAYSKADYFGEYSQSFSDVLNENDKSLSDLNIKIIEWLFKVLDINTLTSRSSELNVSGNRDELLVNICNELKADHYVSPIGSSAYLDESPHFGEGGVNYSYINYSPVEYKQLHGDFIPCLSTIDLIFNQGKQSREIIEKGLSL